jgi:hypothetical protein
MLASLVWCLMLAWCVKWLWYGWKCRALVGTDAVSLVIDGIQQKSFFN